MDLESGSISQITSDEAHDDWASWLNSSSLVFESERVEGWGIFRTPLEPTGDVHIPLRTEVPFTNLGAPAPSPDGASLAFHASRDGGGMKLWLASLQSGEVRQLTDGEWDGLPSWAPDGRSLLFSRQSGGTFDLYVLDLEKGSARRLLAPGP